MTVFSYTHNITMTFRKLEIAKIYASCIMLFYEFVHNVLMYACKRKSDVNNLLGKIDISFY